MIENAESILVIIVSVTLTIFLIAATILVLMAVKVFGTIKRITEKAEHLTDTAEAVGEMIQKSAGPVAVSRVLFTIFDSVKKRSKK